MKLHPKQFSSRWLLLLALVFTVFIGGVVLSTHGVSGQSVRQPIQDIDNVLRQHDLLNLSPRDLVKRARQTGRVTLATSRGTFDLDIEPFDIRTENYRSVAVGADGIARELPRTPSRSFRGKLAGRTDTYVRLVLDETIFEAIIITRDETFFVEPRRNFDRTAPENDFVFYAESSVIQQQIGECGTTLAEDVTGRIPANQSATSAAQAPSPEPVFGPKAEAKVATEADFEFTSAHASETATNQDMTDVMTLIDGIYDAQLGIKLKIVFQRAWTANNDPYTLTAASPALEEFTDNYDGSFAPGTLPTRDVTHMFTGKDLDGGTIGIAYLGTICDAPDAAYGISQSLFSGPSLTSSRIGVTAHEIGHNFGASHPNQEPSGTPAGCNPSIMNSFIQDTDQFCQFSRDQITNHVTGSGGACLTRLTGGCTYSLSGTSRSFGAAGGTGSIDVTAAGGCGWAVAEGAAWLSAAPASGSGPGTVNFTATANTGGPRRAVIDIGGQKLTVLQSASASCGLTPLTPGATLTGNLASTDCFAGQPNRENAYVDLYSFNGMAGQQVRIEMSDDPAVAGTLDTYLYLFAPDGSLIAENDDIQLGTITNSRIPVTAGTFFTLPQTGSYTIVATSYDNNATGQYSVTLTTVPLVLAEQGNGNVVAALDSTIGSNFDTLLGVYTGNSVGGLALVADDDDIVDGINQQSTVTFNATAGTTYRIAVDGFNAAVGNILLNWQQSSCAAASLTVEQNTSDLAAVDSVTFVRGPFSLIDNYNFSFDQRRRIVFFSTDLGFTQTIQPSSEVVSVQIGGQSYGVESVGPNAVLGGSQIVFRLPDLAPGSYPLGITVRGVSSTNSPNVTIVATSPSSPAAANNSKYGPDRLRQMLFLHLRGEEVDAADDKVAGVPPVKIRRKMRVPPQIKPVLISRIFSLRHNRDRSRIARQASTGNGQ